MSGDLSVITQRPIAVDTEEVEAIARSVEGTAQTLSLLVRRIERIDGRMPPELAATAPCQRAADVTHEIGAVEKRMRDAAAHLAALAPQIRRAGEGYVASENAIAAMVPVRTVFLQALLGIPAPVAADRVATNRDVLRPTTVEDAAIRLDEASEVGSTLIETYVDENGQVSYWVYLAGTKSEYGAASDWPSNIHLKLALAAAGADAAALAMEKEGIPDGAHVTFVGYSQGAMIAATLAQRERWATDGIVAIGSPALEFDLPDGVPVLALAHEGDNVVRFSGPLELTRVPETTLVMRSDVEGADMGLLGNHGYDAYIETARLVDEDTDPRIVDARSALFPAAAASGVAAVYSAQRVPYGQGEKTRTSAGGRRAASGSRR